MTSRPDSCGGEGRRRLPHPLRRAVVALQRWFDSGSSGAAGAAEDGSVDRIDWLRVAPYFAIHLGCLGVVWVGWSPAAVVVAIALYVLRMLAITGFYHRYLSHRAFKTSRTVQFVFAVLGASAAQRGPLWWASHHRHHHLNADTPGDAHSPRQHGWLWSHSGWFLSRRNFEARPDLVADLRRFPELVFLDRFDVLVPLLLVAALFGGGALLSSAYPGWGTSGAQLVVWGFFVSTVVLYHATYSINSLGHLIGRRRYATADHSRNNFALALLTLGEGWHNNHHHFPGSARQGFYWWEVDVTYYLLRLLAACGLIWDLKQVPRKMREATQVRAGLAGAGRLF